MLLQVSETAEELHFWADCMKVSQCAKNSDLKSLSNAQHETAVTRSRVDRLKLVQPLLHNSVRGCAQVIPRDPVHASLDHLALSLKSRPHPSQDVRVDALITRTSIRNLLLQGALRRNAMSTQHTP